MMNRKGFTLVEVVVTTFIASIMILVVAKILSSVVPYFQIMSVRRQLENDSRIAMNLMTHFIHEGKASTLILCGCGGQSCDAACTPPSPVPMYSQIQFTLASDPSTSYMFFFLNNSLQMQVTDASGTRVQTLANNVTTLNFMGYGSDPTLVLITLRLDKIATKNQLETVLLPNMVVHMVGTP